jgi:hypothetical protein
LVRYARPHRAILWSSSELIDREKSNTEGYTTEQLDALNAEWEARAAERSLEECTEDYEQAAKAFCDEVSGR